MKIANADKLIHHFKTVVDVHLFTPAEIITIIDTFSAEVTEGRKYVFSYDYDGTPIVTDLDAKQSEEELLGIASEERKEGYWNEIQSGMPVCPFCGAMPHKLYKDYCAKCGAHLIGGAQP